MREQSTRHAVGKCSDLSLCCYHERKHDRDTDGESAGETHFPRTQDKRHGTGCFHRCISQQLSVSVTFISLPLAGKKLMENNIRNVLAHVFAIMTPIFGFRRIFTIALRRKKNRNNACMSRQTRHGNEDLITRNTRA